MRIAIATPYDTKLRAGGGAVIVRYLIEALQAKGIEVVLWLCRDYPAPLQVKLLECTDYRHDWEFIGLPPQLAFSLNRLAPNQFQQLLAQTRKLQAQHPVDALLIFNALTPGIWPMELAQSLGVPYILTLLDYSFLCPKFNRINQYGDFCQGEIPDSTCLDCAVAHLPPAKRPAFQLLRLLPESFRLSLGRNLRPLFPAYGRYHAGSPSARFKRQQDMKDLFTQAAAVVYQSPVMQSQFHQADWQHPNEYIECYGVPTATSCAKSVTYLDPVVQFVYLSRPTQEWGIEFLLETWASYCADKGDRFLTVLSPGISTLLGQHPQWQILPNVEFSEEMIQGRVAEFHARFHVLILPAQWQGIVALTALEALAHGTAVIEPDLGGLPGYSAPSPERLGLNSYKWRDAESLGERINSLCSDRTKLKHLMDAAGQLRSLNEWGHVYFQLLEKFTQTIDVQKQ